VETGLPHRTNSTTRRRQRANLRRAFDGGDDALARLKQPRANLLLFILGKRGEK
jgi:hypothetical protein